MKKILKIIKNKIIPFIAVFGVILSIFCLSVSADSWVAGDYNGEYPYGFSGVSSDDFATLELNDSNPFTFDFYACCPLVDLRQLNTRIYVPMYQSLSDVGSYSTFASPSAYIYDNVNGGVLSHSTTDGISRFYYDGFSYYHWQTNEWRGNETSQLVPQIASYSVSNNNFSSVIALSALSYNEINAYKGESDIDLHGHNFWYIDVGAMYDCQLFIEDVIDLDVASTDSKNFFCDSISFDLLVDSTFVYDSSDPIFFVYTCTYEYLDSSGNWQTSQRVFGNVSAPTVDVMTSSEVAGTNSTFQLILDTHDKTFMRCTFDESYIAPLLESVSEANLPTQYVRNVRISLTPSLYYDTPGSVNTTYRSWISDTNDTGDILFYVETFGYYPVARVIYRYDGINLYGADLHDHLYRQYLINDIGGGIGSDDGSNWFRWLGNAVGGVLDVEIFPNVSFTTILYSIVGLGVLFVVLKYFVGG